LHVDAAQSLGKIPIDVIKMNVDLMSFSSHKIYGPKGIGALYIKHKNKIEPITYGGGQENGIRPGTLPVPLIVGFGEACKKANKNMISESKKIKILRNILLDELQKKIPDLIVNGSIEKRLPGNINLSFPSLKGQSIVTSMPTVALSSGSACSSSTPKSSHVLKAIGLNDNLCNSSIRIGIGRFNTKDEITKASKAIIKAVKIKS
jgi:cysteine desulfurase